LLSVFLGERSEVMKKHFFKVLVISFIAICFILVSVGNFATAQNGDDEERPRRGQAYISQYTQTPYGTQFIAHQYTSALDLALGLIVPEMSISYEVRGFNPYTPSTQITTSSPIGALFGQPISASSFFGTSLLGSCCTGGFSPTSFFGIGAGLSGAYFPNTLLGSGLGASSSYLPSTLFGGAIGATGGAYPTSIFGGGFGGWPATSNYPYYLY